MQQHSRLKRSEGTSSWFSLILNHRLPQYRLLENHISFFQIPWSICCCCSVARSCPIICDPMNCRTPVFSVLHYFPEFAQTHIHWVNDAIQPSYPLSLPSPLALSISQHQGLFQWIGSSHEVAKLLELQLQHQSFQWIFRVDWFDLLAIEGTLKSLPQHHSSKASILWRSAFVMVQLSHPYMTTEKTTAWLNGPFSAK